MEAYFIMSKLPYPEYAATQWPNGKTPERRRIEKCSDPKAWYAKKIGQIITVHYFMSFGCWDTEGRWLHYYDLSEPINPEYQEPLVKKSWIKKLFK